MATAEHFDAVVVGSGFGGSVTAFRLAKENLSVCLLERGKPYGPGDFARTPHAMSRNLWDPSAPSRTCAGSSSANSPAGARPAMNAATAVERGLLEHYAPVLRYHPQEPYRADRPPR